MLTIYLIITAIKWCKSSQTVGHYLKDLFLRKPVMLGKNGIKVFDHIFPHKLILKFLGDHSLTLYISFLNFLYNYGQKWSVSLGWWRNGSDPLIRCIQESNKLTFNIFWF
jgi:hypothetical protein